jgi:hypothetical protein
MSALPNGMARSVPFLRKVSYLIKYCYPKPILFANSVIPAAKPTGAWVRQSGNPVSRQFHLARSARACSIAARRSGSS